MTEFKAGRKYNNRFPNRISKIMGDGGKLYKCRMLADGLGISTAQAYDILGGRAFPRSALMVKKIVDYLNSIGNAKYDFFDIWEV